MFNVFSKVLLSNLSLARHQILIKATSLGLKESSTRGLKKRRETDGMEVGSPVPLSGTNPSVQMPAVAAPDQPTAMSTIASPSLNTQESIASSAPAVAASGIPTTWAMPHVAAASSSVNSSQQSTPQGRNYYRERPNQSPHINSTPLKASSANSTPTTARGFFQPNGGASAPGSESRP